MQIEEKIKEFFKRYDFVELVYLFGSLAKGKSTEKSDVDIAVLLPHYFDKIKCFKLQIEFIGKLCLILKRNDVDVVILNIAPPLLKYIVATTGKVIYEKKKGLNHDFFCKALNEYFDYKITMKYYGK